MVPTINPRLARPPRVVGGFSELGWAEGFFSPIGVQSFEMVLKILNGV